MKYDINLIRNILQACIGGAIYIIPEDFDNIFYQIEQGMEVGYFDSNYKVLDKGREFYEKFKDDNQWKKTMEFFKQHEELPINEDALLEVYCKYSVT